MKYLKKYKLFEDNLSDELELEIAELCYNQLAYLFDDSGFKYNISSEDDYTVLELDYDDEDADIYGFDWHFVKDEIIPFIEILDDKYNLMEIQFYCEGGNEYHNVDDVLNDFDIDGVMSIHFLIKHKN